MSLQQRTMGSIHTDTVPLYDVNRAFENAKYLRYYSPSKDLNNLETHTRFPRSNRRNPMPVIGQDLVSNQMSVSDKGHGTGKAAAGWRALFKRHSVKIHPSNELLVNLFDRSEEELARIAAYFCVETDKAARCRKQTESGVTSTQRVQRAVKISPEVRLSGEPLDMPEDHVVAMFCVEKPEEAMARRRVDLKAEACSQFPHQHRDGPNLSVEGERLLAKKKPNIIVNFLRNMRACFGK